MSDQVIDHVLEFLRAVFTTATALALVALAVAAIRRVWRGPIESIGLIDRMLQNGAPPISNEGDFVNIEYRTATGELVNLGPLVHISLRNGHGTPVNLTDGYFKVHANRIRVGMSYLVSIDGGVSERVRVHIDNDNGGLLYVQSNYAAKEILQLLNGTAR